MHLPGSYMSPFIQCDLTGWTPGGAGSVPALGPPCLLQGWTKLSYCIQKAQGAWAITSHVPECLTFPALILVTILNSVPSLLGNSGFSSRPTLVWNTLWGLSSCLRTSRSWGLCNMWGHSLLRLGGHRQSPFLAGQYWLWWYSCFRALAAC